MRAGILLVVVGMIFGLGSNAQQVIDKSMQFPPGQGFRNYHIYLPSKYNPNAPNKMLFGFHPYNTTRWDGESWRDSLIEVAEYLDLVLICPDGGQDGRIDDDYDYCKALFDSMQVWYNIDITGRYAIGFSVGAKAVYEYALTHKRDFKGMIPIGSAMEGTSSVEDNLVRAKCQNYYIIHGEQDSPNLRFNPIKDSLIKYGANVDQKYMSGVGHTFDFPSRNSIIIKGFRYIDTASCDFTAIPQPIVKPNFEVYPTSVQSGSPVFIEWSAGQPAPEIACFSISGKQVQIDVIERSNERIRLSSQGLYSGVYFIRLVSGGEAITKKIVIK